MKIVAIAGGVGGAKMADGFAALLNKGDLTIIVNTGDDFEHFGLTICPDLDTVCYTLAGLANPITGWGRARDTFHTLECIQSLGGPGWFRIGDLDFATHIERTRLLDAGLRLSEITRIFCRSWGIPHIILPMSDQPVRTLVNTVSQGEMAFQEYFVHQNCMPVIQGVHFKGLESAQPSPGILEAIEKAEAIVFCPSNPWVSIDPILAVPGIRQALSRKKVVGVSPIIGGKTVKGPAAKMFTELGIKPSALAVAQHYSELLSGFIIDKVDEPLAGAFSIPVMVAQTIMNSKAECRRLAQDVLHFIQDLPNLVQ